MITQSVPQDFRSLARRLGSRARIAILAAFAAIGAGTVVAAAEAEPAAAVPAAPARLQVLFLGNSFTRYNGMTVLVEEFAAASKPPCELLTTLHIVGATSLQGHWEMWPPAPFWIESKDPRDLHILSWIRGDTGHLAEQLTRNLDKWKDAPFRNLPMANLEKEMATIIKAGPWEFRQYRDAVARVALAGHHPDCVVLQTYGEQFDGARLKLWLGLYVPVARKNGVRPIVFIPHENFILPVSPEKRKEEDAKLAQVNAACLSAAVENDVDLAPTYLACYKVKKNRPEIALDFEKYGDKHHSGPKCAYLIACSIYATVFNRSPEGLPPRMVFHEIYDGGGARQYEEQTGAKPPATVVLSDDEALYLQRTAWEATCEFRDMVAQAKVAKKEQPAPAADKKWVLVIGGPRLNAYLSTLADHVRTIAGGNLVFAPFGDSSVKQAAAELDDWLGAVKWQAVIVGGAADKATVQLVKVQSC